MTIDETEQEKWDGVVAKLVTMTRKGQVTWSTFRPGTRKDEPPAQDVRGMMYESDYLGRTIFVYEYEYQHWFDEDRFTTDTDVAVELKAKHTNSTWRLPSTALRRELLDEARKRTVEADDFAAAILAVAT